MINKIIFYIRDGFEYEFGVDTYVTIHGTHVLKSEKTQTQSK